MCEALRTTGLQSWKKNIAYLYLKTLMAIVRELKKNLGLLPKFPSFCAVLFIPFHSFNLLQRLL